jgi:hypothetical protein
LPLYGTALCLAKQVETSFPDPADPTFRDPGGPFFHSPYFFNYEKAPAIRNFELRSQG